MGEVPMRTILLIILIAGCRIADEHYVDRLAVPRLKAPLSMSTVTSRMPKLQWELSEGEGTVEVDLCANRKCTELLPDKKVRLADDKLSAAPLQSFEAGWVFWRVRVVHGVEE